MDFNKLGHSASKSYLNGSYFLTSSDYSYFQNESWGNKISNWNYTSANTKTYSASGPSYNRVKFPKIYLHELNKSGNDITIGEWKTFKTKIGLMYLSDYVLSLGSSALNCSSFSGTCAASLQSSWINLNNNDSDPIEISEWTISRYGSNNSGSEEAWAILNETVSTYSFEVNDPFAVRSVFYLEDTEEYGGGTGSLSDPYMLSVSNNKTIREYLKSNPTKGLNTTTSYDGLYRYIGTDVDNYVKIGDVLYRIIGVASENNIQLGITKGQIKVIKAENVGNYKWTVIIQVMLCGKIVCLILIYNLQVY